jgi:hypothetical protein
LIPLLILHITLRIIILPLGHCPLCFTKIEIFNVISPMLVKQSVEQLCK